MRALAAVRRNDVEAAIRYFEAHILNGGDPAEVEALQLLQDDDRELVKRLNAYEMER